MDIVYEYLLRDIDKYNITSKLFKEIMVIDFYCGKEIISIEFIKSKDKCYQDVTIKWLLEETTNSYKVVESNYFLYYGIKFYVDGKNVVLDYSENEKKVAEWLAKTFGGKIYMLPRINKPDGIMSADYLFKGEYWDLKTINGNGKQTLYHAIYKKSQQSNNFIFDMVHSDLSLEETKKQIEKLYNREDTYFLKKAIIKKGKEFIVTKRM